MISETCKRFLGWEIWAIAWMHMVEAGWVPLEVGCLMLTTSIFVAVFNIPDKQVPVKVQTIWP